MTPPAPTNPTVASRAARSSATMWYGRARRSGLLVMASTDYMQFFLTDVRVKAEDKYRVLDRYGIPRPRK